MCQRTQRNLASFTGCCAQLRSWPMTWLGAGVLVLWLTSCTPTQQSAAPHAEPAVVTDSRQLVADSATVFDDTRDAFSLPLPGLSPAGRARFFVGNSFFNQNWVTAPASTVDRDGLGPLFNARSCSGCHFKDGRGRAPDAGAEMQGMLLRVSVPGAAAHGAPKPDAVYGDQIQSSAIAGVAPEARVNVDYVEHTGVYADGEAYTLRQPRYRLEQLGYGPIHGLLMSGRVAPAMLGLGLLEAVPDAELLAHADPEDRDNDGISGRPNRVWDVSAQTERLGRFGWKAEQPSIRQQVASAFLGDMGITSSLFPRENCSEAQPQCQRAPSGGSPELSDDTLTSVEHYARTLAVPQSRALTQAQATTGQKLFRAAHCEGCHVETLHSSRIDTAPELSNLTFHPYTDLLLHDMGAPLADERPAFQADGREFRTAPLWGVGLVPKVNGHNSLLHDGRARGVAEAILWHHGEAEQARAKFAAMTRAERDALVSFVESL